MSLFRNGALPLEISVVKAIADGRIVRTRRCRTSKSPVKKSLAIEILMVFGV